MAHLEYLIEGVLLGMGNPLLDISASVKVTEPCQKGEKRKKILFFIFVTQPELLEKHGWKANDAILTEEETVFEELKEYKVEQNI